MPVAAEPLLLYCSAGHDGVLNDGGKPDAPEALAELAPCLHESKRAR